MPSGKLFAPRFGYYFAIGETRKQRGGVYGNVTLSRWEFAEARPIDSSVPGREQRGVLRTDIQVESSLIHVFNVHLGNRERRTQAVRLVDGALLRAIDMSGPRIVLGDQALITARSQTESWVPVIDST